MVIRIFLLLVTVSTLFTASFATNESLSDSLVKVINAAQTDSDKYNAFLELAKATQTYKPDQSVDVTINALEIAKNLMDERRIAKAYNQLGVSYYHQGELIPAKNFINNAYMIYQNIDDKKGLGATLNGLGVVCYDQGELQQALAYFNEAIKYKKEIRDKAGIAICLNNIGNVYKDLKEFSKAIDYYNQSIALKKEDNDDYGIAMSYNNIGLVYHMQKDFEKAMEWHKKSLELKRKINDKHGEAMSLNNIGWAYQAMENYAAAMNFYQQALDLREIIGDNYGASMTLGNMSDVQTILGNYDKAIFYLNICQMKAKQIGASKLLKDIYLQLSETQVQANDYENAYLSLKKFISLSDSIMGEDKFIELAVLKAEMEAKNAENEVNLLLKEKQIKILQNKRKNILIYTLSIIIILLITLGILVYLRNKDKLRQIELQNQLGQISNLTNSYAIVADRHDKIIWVNEGFTDIMGYSLEDVIGKTPTEILRGPETNIDTINYIEDKKRKHEAFDTEILNYRKDRSKVWLSVSTTVLKNENNEVDRFISFGTDITERKNAEQDIRSLLN